MAALYAAVQLVYALDPSRVVELKGTTYHVQGIDLDERRVWVTSVDSGARKGYPTGCSRWTTGKCCAPWEFQDGARFHPGGISVDAAPIWLPVAEYRPASTSVIQRRNKRTLELESEFTAPDHIGCIAVHGAEAFRRRELGQPEVLRLESSRRTAQGIAESIGQLVSRC